MQQKCLIGTDWNLLSQNGNYLFHVTKRKLVHQKEIDLENCIKD